MKKYMIILCILVICLLGVTVLYSSFRWYLDAKTITLTDINATEFNFIEQDSLIRGIEYELIFRSGSNFLHNKFIHGKNKLGFEIIFPVEVSDIIGHLSGGIGRLNIEVVDKEKRIYSTKTGIGGSHLIDEDIEKCISLQDKIQVNLYVKNRKIKTIKIENGRHIF